MKLKWNNVLDFFRSCLYTNRYFMAVQKMMYIFLFIKRHRSIGWRSKKCSGKTAPSTWYNNIIMWEAASRSKAGCRPQLGPLHRHLKPSDTTNKGQATQPEQNKSDSALIPVRAFMLESGLQQSTRLQQEGCQLQEHTRFDNVLKTGRHAIQVYLSLSCISRANLNMTLDRFRLKMTLWANLRFRLTNTVQV